MKVSAFFLKGLYSMEEWKDGILAYELLTCKLYGSGRSGTLLAYSLPFFLTGDWMEEGPVSI
jgi:hypothetical protein